MASEIPLRKDVTDADGDRHLLERIRRGDHAAFSELYSVYHAKLCSFAYRYVRSPEAAKDIVQEVFLNIWKLRHHWNPNGTVRAYIYKSVRNMAANYYDRLRVEAAARQELREVVRSATPCTPADDLSYQHAAEEIQRAIQNLPERRRLIFILNRIHLLTYEEIACTLDISVNTVDTQMRRALKALRDSLLA